MKYCLLGNTDEYGDDAKIQSYVLTNLTFMKSVFNNYFVPNIKQQHIDMYVRLRVYRTPYLGLIRIYKKLHRASFMQFPFLNS